MPKHRSTVYTVVREVNYGVVFDDDDEDLCSFSALIGTYMTLMRAEEVAGSSKQALLDAGAPINEYRFTVHPVTFYDE